MFFFLSTKPHDFLNKLFIFFKKINKIGVFLYLVGVSPLDVCLLSYCKTYIEVRSSNKKTQFP